MQISNFNFQPTKIEVQTMTSKIKSGRRQAMKVLAAAGLGGFSVACAATPKATAASKIGAMIPGKGWVSASTEQCSNDGTPLQFLPKTAPDATPLQDELKKYPTCPYCGMNRTKWQHSRHLVQYDDDLVDGTCSIHCLAISLSLNIDRGPKAIYAPDFGSDAEVKPMIKVDDATYLIGSQLKGTMTKKSKMAFASADAAKSAQTANGGELASFDEALTAAYVGMAEDTVLTRMRRNERRKKMMQKMKMKMKQ
jgi:nitrous oxide reductase accessory protein NosL